MFSSADPSGGRERAQSATVGIVLLIAITLAGMAVVFTVGASAIDETRDQLDSERAEKALTQFDSKSAMVALGGADRQSIALAEAEGSEYSVEEGAGWMNVTIENTTSGDTAKLANVSLGSLVYESDDRVMAYQGGGVWQRTESGTSMISPPEFHFRNATLTLPIIAVNGTDVIDDRATVEKSAPTNITYPNASLNENFTNPLMDGKVNVTVKSDYYEAWGTYFGQRTSGTASYDHERETATVTLTVPADGTVDNAFTVTGNAGFGGGVTVSGYDSRSAENAGSVTNKDYIETSDGDVFATEDVDTTGSGSVNGDLYVDGDVTVQGSGDVEGTIHATGDVQIENTIDNDIVAGGDVEATGWTVLEEDAEIRAGGGFYISNGGDYAGEIHVGDDVESTGGWTTLESTGSMVAGGSVTGVDEEDGTVTENADPPSLSELDPLSDLSEQLPDPAGEVTQAVSSYETDNDNDEAVFQNFDGGDSANDYLDAGNYYYDGDLSYDGEPSLEFDTADGDINLVVDGDFDGSNVDVDVTGNNRVHVYVTGNAEFSGDAEVTNEDGRGDQFWLYSATTTDETYVQGNEFYGVVYSESAVELGGDTNVYGAIVTDGAGINGGQDIYYDQRLGDVEVFNEPSIPTISYLHVTVNRVNVTSS